MAKKAMIVQLVGDYDKVVIGTHESQAPKAGEITVRLHANSLNYHDFAVDSDMSGPVEPRMPMADGAGEVVAAREGVAEFSLGDHVVSTLFPTSLAGEPLGERFAAVLRDGVDGYARESVTASTYAFTRPPKGWSHAEASTLPTATITAWRAMIADDALKPGDSVLVQGAGGVSIFALQFAKMAGATAIATSSSDEKLERLRALGVYHVLSYQRDVTYRQTACELTGGRGVDHMVEVEGTGNPLTIDDRAQNRRPQFIDRDPYRAGGNFLSSQPTSNNCVSRVYW